MLQLLGFKSEFGGCNMRPASLSDKTMRSCKLTQAQKQSTQSTPKISTNARIQFDVSPCVDLNAKDASYILINALMSKKAIKDILAVCRCKISVSAILGQKRE